MYEHQVIEIVKTYKYLGIVFTTGGSFSEAQNTLAGQAQKAIFKLNKYLYKFTFVAPKHKLELFDKLISPILNYSCEVWGFVKQTQLKWYTCNSAKSYSGLRKQHKMILYMGSWEEKIMPQNEFLSSLNIGSKYYKHLKISILKLYII